MTKAVKPVITAPPFQIVTQTTKQRWLKAIFYGEYGVGKTWLAASACAVPAMNSVLFIDAEAGDMTLDASDKSLPFEKIERVLVQDFAQVARVQEFLQVHCRLRDDPTDENMERLCKLEDKMKSLEPGTTTEPVLYKTVIIDSLTEVEAFCMYQLLGIRLDTKVDEEVSVAEWPDYKRQTSQIQRLIRSFRNLPMNLIMTCARRYQQDEQKRFNYNPAMTGQLANIVQGFVDVVGYLQIADAREDGTLPRRLQIQPGPRWAAKCRIATLKKPYIDMPTIGKIVEASGVGLG